MQRSDEHADVNTNLEATQAHLDFINTGFLRALDALPGRRCATAHFRIGCGSS